MTSAPMGSHGGQAHLAAGPGGTYDTVWTEGGYNSFPLTLQGDTYTASGGWGTPATVTTSPGSEFDDVRVLAAADGATTAVWTLNLSGSGNSPLESSVRVSSGWGPSRTVANLGPYISSIDAAISPSGLLTFAYSVATQRSGSNNYDFALSAVSQFYPRPLVATAAPTVFKAARVGSTVLAKVGTWNAQPTKYSYQWCRNGKPVPKAVHRGYRVTLADAGAKLSVTVSAHRAGYLSGSSTSAAVTVPRPALRNTARPTISGKTVHGNLLTAHPGHWSPSPSSFRYRWLRNGSPIAHAVHATYRTGKADRGRALTVRVTAARSPYASASALSVVRHVH